MEATHISVRIPPSLNKQLLEYVKDNGLSKTEVMISALADYLNSQTEVPLPTRVSQLEIKVKEIENLIKK